MPLISVEELKHMNCFEALILILRMMLFRTTLTPDYQINWNFVSTAIKIPERKDFEINIFDLKIT